MTYRKRKFFVQLIVNFDEIQHYTWLGTFWNYVYKYTYIVNLQKTFIYTAPSLHFSFFLSSFINQVLPIILSLLLYSSFILQLELFFRHLLFHLDCILPPEYHDLTRFLVSTRFLTGYLLDFYQISYRIFP